MVQPFTPGVGVGTEEGAQVAAIVVAVAVSETDEVVVVKGADVEGGEY